MDPVPGTCAAVSMEVGGHGLWCANRRHRQSCPVSFGIDCDEGVAPLAEGIGQQDLGQGGASFEPDIHIHGGFSVTDSIPNDKNKRVLSW